VGRCKRRFKKTTIADPNAETKAIDLICRNFGVGVREIDTAWCGDITYSAQFPIMCSCAD
jgi:hypothetical protein